MPENPVDAAKLNQALKGRDVKVTMSNDAEAEGTDFRLSADSALWFSYRSRDTIRLPSDSIKTIRVRNPVPSTVGGLILGVPIGAVAGYYGGMAIFGSNAYGGHDNPGAGFALLIGGVLGGAIGGVIGYGMGYDVYSFLRTPTSPKSIQTRADFVASDVPVRHVVVTVADSSKDLQVFGVLLSDTPTVRLRVSKDRVWEIPLASVRKIQSIGRDNVEMSGLKFGWIVTRTDQSTVVADSLTRYENGNLEMDFFGSRIVLGIDEIQSLEQCSLESDDRSIWERGFTAGLVTCGVVAIIEGPGVGLLVGALVMPIAGIVSQASSIVAGQGGSSFNVSRMSKKQKEATLWNLVRQEHERNATK